MALCLAASLLEQQGFDPVDQQRRYVRWYREGYMSSTGHCFDIGNTIGDALTRFEQTGDPYSGSTDPMSAGNGSIMRLAPVPIFYAATPGEAIVKCGESSRPTHGTAAAVDACRYFGALLVGALNGASKEDLLAPAYAPIADYWVKYPLQSDIARVAAGSFKERHPPAIRGSGYVVDSLEAALWAFYQSHSFREGCLLAVNLGDDADTTGAVYGQLAGAFYGQLDLPSEWRAKLAKRSLLKEFADQLYG